MTLLHRGCSQGVLNACILQVHFAHLSAVLGSSRSGAQSLPTNQPWLGWMSRGGFSHITRAARTVESGFSKKRGHGWVGMNWYIQYNETWFCTAVFF